MKNFFLVIFSTLSTIILIYIAVFFYTFINLNKEFKYSFNSINNLEFHKKYSEKLHHIRDTSTILDSFKTVETEDLLFTRLNKKNKKNLIVLFQGDSWMEMMVYPAEPDFISVNAIKNTKPLKNIHFVNSGIASYSPSLMSIQLDILEKDFGIFPDILISYIDQTDIGDENCRYKHKKIFQNSSLLAVEPESYYSNRSIFNYSKIYSLSQISLSNYSDTVKTFKLINFKIKYKLIRLIKKNKRVKCYYGELEKYLINPQSAQIQYFEKSLNEYLKKIKQKKNIKKVFLVTFPHKKHFEKSYSYNVSSSVDKVSKNNRLVKHINFSKILLNNKEFKYKDIWNRDQIHLDFINYKKLFLRPILDELIIYIN